MTPSQKLRSIADSTGLDGIADAIREIANEIEHNNAPAVPLGYINAGHLHEMQSGRLPYAYLYAAPGVGVEVPVYAPAPAPAVPQGWRISKTRLDGREATIVNGPGGGCVACKDADIPRVVPESILYDLATTLLTATPAPAPAQEAVTLTLAAEDVHAAFTKNFPKTRISQAWISFAADIAQAIAARAAKPAQGEPFGYFRAEPFGWADCSEDADGAIALYEHPAKPAQEVGLADGDLLNWIERQDLQELSMGVVLDAPHDGEYFVTGDDGVTHYGKTLRAAIIAALRAKGGK